MSLNEWSIIELAKHRAVDAQTAMALIQRTRSYLEGHCIVLGNQDNEHTNNGAMCCQALATATIGNYPVVNNSAKLARSLVQILGTYSSPKWLF